MPNHVENDLSISGSKADVTAVLALVGADQSPPKFDFSAVIPYPEQFRILDDEHKALEAELGSYFAASRAMTEKHGVSDGYNNGGYEWCLENWGTKWSAYDVARRDYRGCVVTFQTPWRAPVKLIAALHRTFPSVTFHLEYFEHGMGFCGGVSFLADDDECEGDTPVPPGTPRNEWRCDGYNGRRGG